jgi:hypothetical protein
MGYLKIVFSLRVFEDKNAKAINILLDIIEILYHNRMNRKI